MKFAAQDWPAISALLDEALDLPAERRSAWLDELPAGSRAFRETLKQLLADHASVETQDFLRTLPKVGISAETSAPAPEEGSRTVGPYRLLREIGRGGMGSVWLAERSDGLLKRQVALKLPHPGLATRAFGERLSRERDILASLAHPHIARLYDAGVTPDGQPYIALAYVQGQTLIEHCDARRLGVRERIALFQQVLDAVQYAHAHLVIHRDIKPSNVLVDEQGQVHLLDFGIAKLLVDGQAHATELTLDAGAALTPDYAAPEQIAGAAISTASDVYSLGVLLYELLAGARPYRLQRLGQAALEHAVGAVEVPRPSTVAAAMPDAGPARRTTAAQLARALRGDLDTIVLKALKKLPEERYTTVQALQLDLQRYLDGEPVLARPDSAAYRVRKFLGRHRWPVALGSALAAALLIGGSTAAWEAHVAARERDHALDLLARNEAVNEFLELFISEAAQSPRPITVSELLARSEALASAEFRRQPELQAVVLAMLGLHHRALGGGAKAEELLTRAVEAARGSHDVSLRARLGCQYAATIEMLGRIDEARQQLRSIAGRDDIDPVTAAECFAYLAFLDSDTNDGPAAIDDAHRALDRLKASPRASPSLEASYTGLLAFGLHLAGRNADAAREYAKVLARYAELGREASPNAIAIRSDFAVVNDGAGDPRSALSQYDENLALIAQRGTGPAPLFLLANRARALEVSGRASDAATAYGTALAAAQTSANVVVVRYCLLGLASVALDAGRLDEAQALAVRFAAAGSTPPAPGSQVALAEHILRGRLALARHRPQDANAEFTVAVGERRPNGATVTALNGRAEAALQEGRLDAALQDARDAAALAQTLQGGKPSSVRTGLALLTEGRILARSGDAAGAQAAYRSAQQHLSATVDAAHPALAQLQTLLGS